MGYSTNNTYICFACGGNIVAEVRAVWSIMIVWYVIFGQERVTVSNFLNNWSKSILITYGHHFTAFLSWK